MLALVAWTSGASAQAELTGTFIRYLRVGANGALVDIPGMRSMQYSSAGTPTGATCDLYYPGTPAVGFTVRATPAGGAAAQASNNSSLTEVSALGSPVLSGRAIDWSGRWTAANLRVDQRVEYAVGDHVARMTVTLTNEGSVALNDVYYFYSGDPDHGECNIGSAFDTNNDVLRQFPANTSALATATAGAPAITFGLGSPDARARANNSGFENTDAVAAWNTPVDAGGALLDEDIGIVFREPSIPAGESTTFVIYLVWGTSTAEVQTRFDAAVAADVELTGTYIRYLRVGPDGAMINRTAGHSMQYSELGGTTDVSCDVYNPGIPALGFTLAATAGATTVTGSNVQGTTNITARSGPYRAGRTARWTGNWSSGAVNLDVEQVYEYPADSRRATLTVRLTNRGAGTLTNVHYFFSGDPDFASCNIGGTPVTTNDVMRQRPADSWAIATAAAGTPNYVLGLGSSDTRARANNGGFGNTNAVAAFSTPVDSNNTPVDEDIGLVFREASLAPGASTTFRMYLAWGRTQAELETRIVGGAVNGASCTSGSTCASGNCVDGVCCNSACGGGAAGDCLACSTAAGAAVNGTCGAAGGGVICRASAGTCDAPEMCSGTSTTCPADGFTAAGTICRASTGGCDPAEACDGATAACPSDALAATGTVCRAATDACDADETCDGATAACPADGLVAAGTECRAASGPCDVAEACDGAGAACPADAFAAVGTECRPSAGDCDVAEACDGVGAACPADMLVPAGMTCRPSAAPCDLAEACDGATVSCPIDMLAPDGTTCDDGAACNGDEVCAAGACTTGTAIDCDDGDVCTADSCAEPGTCEHAPITGCCSTAAECDDGDPCTRDSCASSACTNEPIAGCGETDAGTETDGGVSDDASVDTDAGTGGETAGGCGCRAAGSDGSPLGVLIAVGLLAAVLRRRRRRA